MRRFFSFLMLLTAMTGLGSIFQTAKAAYSGYQIESGYYYLKAVETAETRPGTVAQFIVWKFTKLVLCLKLALKARNNFCFCRKLPFFTYSLSALLSVIREK